MAHAGFNVKPLRLLSALQYNISMSNKQSTTTTNHQEKSPVTFQITVPTEESDVSMATNPIDIPGASNHRIQLNDQDLITNSIDLAISTDLATSFGQSPYILPADELTVYFDGLAVQSPTGSCLYSPQQIYSPVNIGSPQSPSFLNTNYVGSPQSPSFLNANTSCPQSPSFLNTNQSFVGSPQSPFLNANTLFGSSATQTYNDAGFVGSPSNQVYSGNSYVGSPSNQAYSYVGSPSNQIYSGNSYVGSPTNQVFSGLGSPVGSNVQSYVGSPNSTYFINSPVINTTSDETNTNSLGLTTYLSPITTPSPTSSYTDPSSLLFPSSSQFCTNQEPSTSRPTSPLPDDVILTTSEVTQYYQLQPDPQPQKKIKKSTVKIVTPSGRKAKIHKCPYCQHTSNRANNMREHIQIHNPNRPKPHICKLCRKSFARKHDMNRHVLSCKNSKKKA